MRGTSIFNIVSILGLSALTSACGNFPSSQGYYGSSSSYDTLGTPPSGNPPLPGSGSTQACAGPSNVNPQAGGSESFRVCADSNSASSILVMGGSQSSASICVFPAQATAYGGGAQSVLWMQDSSKLPLSSCQAQSTSGTTFNFNGVSGWNSVYIVDQSLQSWFEGCLIYGAGTGYCPYWPPFAFGVIR